MNLQKLIAAAAVTISILSAGCVIQKDTTAPAPQAWLSVIARNPPSKINGTYQLFPVEVSNEIGHDDRFNLYDLLSHSGSQMSGIRSYDSITLYEANGLLSVQVTGSGAKPIVAALHAEKDYKRNDESVQFIYESAGDGESGRFTSVCTVALYQSSDQFLLIRFQEKSSRTDMLFVKENRDIDLWLRFAPKRN